METGHDKVQGTDYAYTLHGWIKGVNSNSLKSANDIGKDGNGNITVSSADINKFNGRDVYGYSLAYFNNSTEKDYIAINGSGITASHFIATAPSVQTPDLYNGNIRQMVSSYLDASSPGKTYNTKALLKNFTYDQLNRIATAGANDNLNMGSNSWGTTSSASLYSESFTYDQNGNIQNAQRNGNQSGSYAMDDLEYKYVAGTNQLDYVTDAVASDPYTTDISSQSAGNYDYDQIGNLIKDNTEGISSIDWTVYGKIKKITFTNGKPNLYFKYDASGNRISKAAYHGSTMTGKAAITYYVRDAQGNVMATYEQKPDVGNNPQVHLAERHIYGSSRLGVDNSIADLTSNIVTPLNITSTQRTLNYRSYELSNHLGNVLATVSDRKIAVDAGNDGTTDYFTGEVLSANDYYSFGATMPGRSFTSGNQYRYNFNGKESDPETGTQDYGMRIYNPSLGKFLSVDPLTKKYPELTPYQFASNRPIDGIDQDGLEYATFTIFVQYGKVTNITTATDYELKDKLTLGPGIKYNYAFLDENGKIDKFIAMPLVKNNIYGIYAGSKNPQLPKIGGDPFKVSDDYRLDPINETDGVGKKHDLAYDNYKLHGFFGILDPLSKEANTNAANESKDIMIRYFKGDKDKITGKEITLDQAKGAQTIFKGFTAAEGFKPVINAPGNAVDAVKEVLKDVKNKVSEGIDAINNMAPH